jgi:hypothetical protein
MTQPKSASFDHLVEQYLGLEELSAMEELLDLCGAEIDMRALPLLRRRLQEEKVHAAALGTRGYVRMHEKCEQRVYCLKQLIEALEGMEHGTTKDTLEAKY